MDLKTNRVVKVEAAQHLRTPLSQSEFDQAQEMAREKSAEVKQLYERFGDQLSVYPQFSQFTVKDDPRVHRVVHLTYRVGKRDLSYPRPQVDLTIARGRNARRPTTRAAASGSSARRVETAAHGGRVVRNQFRIVTKGTCMLLSPVRTGAILSLFVALCIPPSAVHAQRFFRQAVADPPAQEVTTEFLISESGGLEPRKGTAWKVHFARGVHKGLYHHRGLVQARPGRRLDQGLERRPRRRAVRPLSSIKLYPLLRS